MTCLRFVVLSMVLAVGGCGSPEVADAPLQNPEPIATSEAPVDVGLKVVTFDEWNAELAAMKGSIVVVDLWATWCVPCIERFPRMVAMADVYDERGVRFVSLSLDDRDDEVTLPQVNQFLEKNDASRLSNYLMDEIIPDAFEKLDLLGIPAVRVYDAGGELRYRLTGDDPNNQFTEEDVEEAIRELIRQRESGNAEREG